MIISKHYSTMNYVKYIYLTIGEDSSKAETTPIINRLFLITKVSCVTALPLGRQTNFIWYHTMDWYQLLMIEIRKQAVLRDQFYHPRKVVFTVIKRMMIATCPSAELLRCLEHCAKGFNFQNFQCKHSVIMVSFKKYNCRLHSN